MDTSQCDGRCPNVRVYRHGTGRRRYCCFRVADPLYTRCSTRRQGRWQVVEPGNGSSGHCLQHQRIAAARRCASFVAAQKCLADLGAPRTDPYGTESSRATRPTGPQPSRFGPLCTCSRKPDFRRQQGRITAPFCEIRFRVRMQSVRRCLSRADCPRKHRSAERVGNRPAHSRYTTMTGRHTQLRLR